MISQRAILIIPYLYLHVHADKLTPFRYLKIYSLSQPDHVRPTQLLARVLVKREPLMCLIHDSSSFRAKLNKWLLVILLHFHISGGSLSSIHPQGLVWDAIKCTLSTDLHTNKNYSLSLHYHWLIAPFFGSWMPLSTVWNSMWQVWSLSTAPT